MHFLVQANDYTVAAARNLFVQAFVYSGSRFAKFNRTGHMWGIGRLGGEIT